MIDKKKNYYDVLGIKRNASLLEIKKSYRKMAKSEHPDTGGSENRIQLLNEAYAVLSDLDKRKQYDDLLSVQDFRLPTWKKDTVTPLDIHVSVNIPLSTALFGGKIKLTFERIIESDIGIKIQKETIDINVCKQIRPMGIIKISNKGNTICNDGKTTVGNLYVMVNYPLSENGITYDNSGVNITVKIPFYMIWNNSEVDVQIDKTHSASIKLSFVNKDGIYIIDKMFGDLPLIVKVIEELPEKNIDSYNRSKIINVMEEVYGMRKRKTFPTVTSGHI